VVGALTKMAVISRRMVRTITLTHNNNAVAVPDRLYLLPV